MHSHTFWWPTTIPNPQAASQLQGLRKTPSWDRSSSSSEDIFKIPGDDCDIVWSMGDRKRKIENERTKDVTFNGDHTFLFINKRMCLLTATWDTVNALAYANI